MLGIDIGGCCGTGLKIGRINRANSFLESFQITLSALLSASFGERPLCDGNSNTTGQFDSSS
jgi:hypothetical protein